MEPKCNPVHSSRPLATGLVQQHEALNLLGTLILERLLRARHPLSIQVLLYPMATMCSTMVASA